MSRSNNNLRYRRTGIASSSASLPTRSSQSTSTSVPRTLSRDVPGSATRSENTNGWHDQSLESASVYASALEPALKDSHWFTAKPRIPTFHPGRSAGLVLIGDTTQSFIASAPRVTIWACMTIENRPNRTRFVKPDIFDTNNKQHSIIDLVSSNIELQPAFRWLCRKGDGTDVADAYWSNRFRICLQIALIDAGYLDHKEFVSDKRASSHKLVAMIKANREVQSAVDSRVAADISDAENGRPSGRGKRKRLSNGATPPQDSFSSRSTSQNPSKRRELLTSASTHSDDPGQWVNPHTEQLIANENLKHYAEEMNVQNDTLKKAREMLKESEKALQARIADMQKIIEVKESQIINQAMTHSDNESRIASLQDSLTTKDATIQQQDQAGREETEKRKSSEDALKETKRVIVTQKTQIADLETTNSDYATRTTNLETSNNTKCTQILELQRALEDRKAIFLQEEERHKRLQTEIERLQVDMNAKVDHLESVNKTHVSDIAKLQASLSEKGALIQELKQTSHESEKKALIEDAKCNRLQADIDHLQAEKQKDQNLISVLIRERSGDGHGGAEGIEDGEILE